MSWGKILVHINKKLFCFLRSICNLVLEFNGLVSNKGQRELALLHFAKSEFFQHPFSAIFFNHFVFSLQLSCFSFLPLAHE